MESSEDNLDSDIDKRRVVLSQKNSERKMVEAVAKKIKGYNKRTSQRKNEVRVDTKENDVPVRAEFDQLPKGKPGKLVRILDEQIKKMSKL